MLNWTAVVVAFCAGYLFRVVADPWLRPDATGVLESRLRLTGTQHLYLSPACYHERHGQCLRRCGFCVALCQCVCHRGQAVEPEAAHAK